MVRKLFERQKKLLRRQIESELSLYLRIFS